MKKVYVVCATGVATSTMVRMRVEEYLGANGIPALVTQYRVSELSADRVDADVIVTTTGMPPEYAEVVPVINAVPLLTGIGEEAVLEKLKTVLTAPSQKDE
ncbi:MAG: PTS sugar transporter subunit IIB [Salinibacterium sp.]|nr:PTS sugar transporter subunit IIB [Salinibacterium sp.]